MNKIDDNLEDFLISCGYSHLSVKDNGKVCGLMNFIFTTGLMVGLNLDDYEIRYCYENFDDALAALEKFNGVGDPSGPWIKAKGLGQDRLNEAWSCENGQCHESAGVNHSDRLQESVGQIEQNTKPKLTRKRN